HRGSTAAQRAAPPTGRAAWASRFRLLRGGARRRRRHVQRHLGTCEFRLGTRCYREKPFCEGLCWTDVPDRLSMSTPDQVRDPTEEAAKARPSVTGREVRR